MKLNKIFIMIGAILTFGLALNSPINASEIKGNGLTADEAVLTNRSGQVMNHHDELEGDGYQVAWHWSILDHVKIEAGDTMTIELPENVKLTNPVTFNLYNRDGVTVGTVAFKAGYPTGIITFNDALTATNIDRKGTVCISANGRQASNEVEQGWFINKTGWWDDANHTKINWNIAFNPDAQDLGKVTITDMLSSNQQLIDGTVIAQTGTWDHQGRFTPDGGTLPVKVTQVGKNHVFELDAVNKGVNIVYQTKAQGNQEGDIYTNEASLESSRTPGTGDSMKTSSMAQLSFGGCGTGDGSNEPQNPEQPIQPVEPEKPKQPTKQHETNKPKQPAQPNQSQAGVKQFTKSGVKAEKVKVSNQVVTPDDREASEKVNATTSNSQQKSAAKQSELTNQGQVQPESSKKKSHALLPNTGMTTNEWLSLAGLVILMILSGCFLIFKQKQHK